MGITVHVRDIVIHDAVGHVIPYQPVSWVPISTQAPAVWIDMPSQ